MAELLPSWLKLVDSSAQRSVAIATLGPGQSIDITSVFPTYYHGARRRALDAQIRTLCQMTRHLGWLALWPRVQAEFTRGTPARECGERVLRTAARDRVGGRVASYSPRVQDLYLQDFFEDITTARTAKETATRAKNYREIMLHRSEERRTQNNLFIATLHIYDEVARSTIRNRALTMMAIERDLATMISGLRGHLQAFVFAVVDHAQQLRDIAIGTSAVKGAAGATSATSAAGASSKGGAAVIDTGASSKKKRDKGKASSAGVLPTLDALTVDVEEGELTEGEDADEEELGGLYSDEEDRQQERRERRATSLANLASHQQQRRDRRHQLRAFAEDARSLGVTERAEVGLTIVESKLKQRDPPLSLIDFYDLPTAQRLAILRALPGFLGADAVPLYQRELLGYADLLLVRGKRYSTGRHKLSVEETRATQTLSAFQALIDNKMYPEVPIGTSATSIIARNKFVAQLFHNEVEAQIYAGGANRLAIIADFFVKTVAPLIQVLLDFQIITEDESFYQEFVVSQFVETAPAARRAVTAVILGRARRVLADVVARTQHTWDGEYPEYTDLDTYMYLTSMAMTGVGSIEVRMSATRILAGIDGTWIGRQLAFAKLDAAFKRGEYFFAPGRDVLEFVVCRLVLVYGEEPSHEHAHAFAIGSVHPGLKQVDRSTALLQLRLLANDQNFMERIIVAMNIKSINAFLERYNVLVDPGLIPCLKAYAKLPGYPYNEDEPDNTNGPNGPGW